MITFGNWDFGFGIFDFTRLAARRGFLIYDFRLLIANC